MLNKVMLIGRLCADPEVKYMQSGDQVATMNIATNRRWKDKSGERKEEVEFHRVTFFGGVAKVCGDYLKKGSQVYIEGRIKTDKYQKDGVDVYRTGIVGEQMNMLDSRSGSNESSSGYSGNSSGHNAPSKQQSAPSAGWDDYDDTNIPFDSLNWQIRRHLL